MNTSTGQNQGDCKREFMQVLKGKTLQILTNENIWGAETPEGNPPKSPF